jgi:hypothetical protein
MLVNALISGFYQTIAVNDSIYQHQLVKTRFDWLFIRSSPMILVLKTVAFLSNTQTWMKILQNFSIKH